MASNSVKHQADERSPDAAHSLRVLLVGNYLRDGQESMQRFAQAMLAGLRERGVDAELLRPGIVLGRLGDSSHSGIGKWLAYFDKFVIFPWRLKWELGVRRRRNASIGNTVTVVHICDHSNAFYTCCLQGVAHVVTCHDLLAVRSALGEIPQNPTRWSGRRLQAMILSGLNRAQRVACVSKATQLDVLRLSKLGGAAVFVIPNSLNYPYSPMPESEALSRLREIVGRIRDDGPEPGFILHVGGNQWYKNRLGVLRIFALLMESDGKPPSLVMVGEDFTAEIKTFIAEKQMETVVFRIESCSNDELRALYSAAGVLLFPSLAEGFGWPVIEAQACGCPVVCSRIDPLPEVAGGGAIFVDSGDEQGYADAIRQLIASPDLRGQIIEDGYVNAGRYQPARVITDYLDCYSKLPVHTTCASSGASRGLRTTASLPA
jgi:glycosyltransferase involved in cell wall biosynthesis